jgi:hypothetical protein
LGDAGGGLPGSGPGGRLRLNPVNASTPAWESSTMAHEPVITTAVRTLVFGLDDCGQLLGGGSSLQQPARDGNGEAQGDGIARRLGSLGHAGASF